MEPLKTRLVLPLNLQKVELALVLQLFYEVQVSALPPELLLVLLVPRLPLFTLGVVHKLFVNHFFHGLLNVLQVFALALLFLLLAWLLILPFWLTSLFSFAGLFGLVLKNGLALLQVEFQILRLLHLHSALWWLAALLLVRRHNLLILARAGELVGQ